MMVQSYLKVNLKNQKNWMRFLRKIVTWKSEYVVFVANQSQKDIQNDDGYFHFCSDSEFENYMDLTYGEGKWRPEETGLKNWCYEYLEEDDE